jgi:uncharacterized membrane protein
MPYMDNTAATTTTGATVTKTARVSGYSVVGDASSVPDRFSQTSKPVPGRSAVAKELRSTSAPGERLSL